MHMSIGKKTVMAALGAALSALSLAAQQVTPLPDGYVKVSAPYAQKITVAAMNKHTNVIQKIGLHATPPNATDNVIIASNLPVKIGKKSSPGDMQNLAANKPHLLRDEKGHFYDLLLPIADAKGRDIGGGFIVMEVPYADAADESAALKIGAEIRDEVQKQIPSKAALYR